MKTVNILPSTAMCVVNNTKKVMNEREKALSVPHIILKNNVQIYDDAIQSLIDEMILRKLCLDSTSFESFAYRHMACFIRRGCNESNYVLRREFHEGGT